MTESPRWGHARDLLRLIDVQPTSPGHFEGPPYPTPRNVVEGGQLLADAIVAASKTIPDQRVTAASMIFTRAADFDHPVDVGVDVLRKGRTFSTVEVRIDQLGKLRSAGVLLMDAGAEDVIRGGTDMPDIVGPEQAVPYDFGVAGRDLRVVDAAYAAGPDEVGPPEICAWVRFEDDPGAPYLHTALLAQSATHWTIAASMRPHKGVGEVLAHRTLSTGVMTISMAFLEPVDVTQWHLYVNPSTYAGRGLSQGEGHVFTQDGQLVAQYLCQATVRRFDRTPESMGMDDTTVM
jgi:acyl-CoA thioesterase II